MNKLDFKCPNCGGTKFIAPITGGIRVDLSATKKRGRAPYKGKVELTNVELEFNPVFICCHCKKPIRPKNIDKQLDIEENIQEMLGLEFCVVERIIE